MKKELSFMELKTMTESTKGIKKPSVTCLRNCMGTPIASKCFLDNTYLNVYQCGFALYQTANHATVLSLEEELDLLREYDLDMIEQLNHDAWTIKLTLMAENKIMKTCENIAKKHFGFTLDAPNAGWELRENYSNNENAWIDSFYLEKLFEKTNLTERQKQILLMYYCDELTQSEIAERLNIKQQSVGEALHAALKKLKKFI